MKPEKQKKIFDVNDFTNVIVCSKDGVIYTHKKELSVKTATTMNKSLN